MLVLSVHAQGNVQKDNRENNLTTQVVVILERLYKNNGDTHQTSNELHCGQEHPAVGQVQPKNIIEKPHLCCCEKKFTVNGFNQQQQYGEKKNLIFF